MSVPAVTPGINQNSYAVTVPNDFGNTLTAFATAKPLPTEAQSAIPSVFKQVITLKAALNNGKTQPTGDQIRSGIEILKQLRETYASSLTLAKDARSVASAKDRRIPLLGIRIPFLASKEARTIDKAISEVKKQDATNASVLKELETKKLLLEAALVSIQTRCYTAKMPKVTASTCADLKSNMPQAEMLFVDGNQQNSVRGIFDSLFTALNMSKDEAVLASRTKSFSTVEGDVPELKGHDLDVLKHTSPKRFDDVSNALKAHCNKAEFKAKDGFAFFVPSEKLEDRKIYIKTLDGSVSISHESTFALSRKQGEEPVATVTAKHTTVVDATNKVLNTICTFTNIIPNPNLIRMPDVQKLERIFDEKSKVKATEATITA